MILDSVQERISWMLAGVVCYMFLQIAIHAYLDYRIGRR
jgi:hypothetical protein